MRKTSYRKLRAVLIGFGTAMVLSTVTSPVAGTGAADMFTGGGFGPTAQTAVQAAIWDAENSAYSSQMYSCQLAGEPLIFSRRHPYRGTTFNAEATLNCSR